MMIVACKEFAVHQTKKGGKQQITPSTWGEGGEGGQKSAFVIFLLVRLEDRLAVLFGEPES
jgi:hypothetical protein